MAQKLTCFGPTPRPAACKYPLLALVIIFTGCRSPIPPQDSQLEYWLYGSFGEALYHPTRSNSVELAKIDLMRSSQEQRSLAYFQTEGVNFIGCRGAFIHWVNFDLDTGQVPGRYRQVFIVAQTNQNITKLNKIIDTPRIKITEAESVDIVLLAANKGDISHYLKRLKAANNGYFDARKSEEALKKGSGCYIDTLQ